MNKIEERATQIIPQLDDSLVTYVKLLLDRKMARGEHRPMSTYRGAEVYLLGDKQAGYVTLVKNGEILYFVRHELIKHNKMQLGRQVLVWSNAESHEATGFAAHIFFKYLLPKYKALIADQQQTKDGYRFWRYALDRAFTENLKVYYLDRRSTPNVLTKLATYQDVIDNSADMWGEDAGHKRTFAVISSVPLQIKV